MKIIFPLLLLLLIPLKAQAQVTPKIRQMALEAAILEKVSFLHLLSICAAESEGFKKIPRKNKHGERGVCQVRKETWKANKCKGNPHGLQGTFHCAAKLIKKAIIRCKLGKNALPHIAFFYNVGRCAKKYPKNRYVSWVRFWHGEFTRKTLFRKRITLAMIGEEG